MLSSFFRFSSSGESASLAARFMDIPISVAGLPLVASLEGLIKSYSSNGNTRNSKRMKRMERLITRVDVGVTFDP